MVEREGSGGMKATMWQKRSVGLDGISDGTHGIRERR
jgi:hypothetical protein